MNNNDYFFKNIFPYLSKKEQKECLKEVRKKLKSINSRKNNTEKKHNNKRR